MNILIYNITFW